MRLVSHTEAPETGDDAFTMPGCGTISERKGPCRPVGKLLRLFVQNLRLAGRKGYSLDHVVRVKAPF
jgi:hypothetical protein